MSGSFFCSKCDYHSAEEPCTVWDVFDPVTSMHSQIVTLQWAMVLQEYNQNQYMILVLLVTFRVGCHLTKESANLYEMWESGNTLE